MCFCLDFPSEKTLSVIWNPIPALRKDPSTLVICARRRERGEIHEVVFRKHGSYYRLEKKREIKKLDISNPEELAQLRRYYMYSLKNLRFVSFEEAFPGLEMTKTEMYQLEKEKWKVLRAAEKEAEFIKSIQGGGDI